MQGLASNLLNPKMLAFFGALLPQFAASGSRMLFLGLMFAAMTLLWLTIVAYLATAIINDRPALARIIDGLAGIALTALGTHLLVARRTAPWEPN